MDGADSYMGRRGRWDAVGWPVEIRTGILQVSDVKMIAPVTERFIAAVCRRMIFVRIAESVGISWAIASGAALATIPVLWWSGMGAWPAILGFGGLGLFAGIVWGISRRPSRVEAAVEADRQLDLHDLLGTICLMRDSGESTWQDSLAAYAEARCRTLRPSGIIVARLGMRGWAGVGVLGLLVMTLGMLVGKPQIVTAASAALAQRELSDGESGMNRAELARAVGRPPGVGGVDDHANTGFEDRSEDDVANAVMANGDSRSGSGAGTEAGAGTGMAVTARPLSIKRSDGSVSLKSAFSRTGAAAAGMGSEDAGANVTGANRSSVASPMESRRVASWSAAGWANEARTAENLIQSGRVPDADADLVRDYFRRD